MVYGGGSGYTQIGRGIGSGSAGLTTPTALSQSYSSGHPYSGTVYYNYPGESYSGSGSHTYEVRAYAVFPSDYCGSNHGWGGQAVYYYDSSQINSDRLSWSSGVAAQINNESHQIGNRIGANEFGDTRYCNQSSPGAYCSVNQVYYVSSYNGSGEANPNGCYSQRSGNDFQAYDMRSQTPPGC